MLEASDNLMFEAAAKYRDRIEALSKLWQRQKVVGPPDMEEDAIAFYTDDACSCISVFYIRGGSLVDNEHFLFPAEQLVDEENMVAFLDELYNIREYVPKEILLDFVLPDEDIAMLAGHIEQRCGTKPEFRTPAARATSGSSARWSATTRSSRRKYTRRRARRTTRPS